MADSHPDSPESDLIAQAAALWLARRDRDLTAAEQDAYLQWLGHDPRHGAALAHLEKNWRALDALAHWRPAHSAAQPGSPGPAPPHPLARGRRGVAKPEQTSQPNVIGSWKNLSRPNGSDCDGFASSTSVVRSTWPADTLR